MATLNFKGKRNDSPSSSEGSLKFNKIFTGEAFVTPLIFNPTAEQIKQFKKLPDSLEVKEPNYIVEKVVNKESGEKRPVRKVSLLTTFDPNKFIKHKAGETVVKYGQNYFLNYEILISNTLVTSDKSDKMYVIDAKMNTAWVNCNLEKVKALGEKLRLARKSGDATEIEDAKDEITKFTRKAVKEAAAAMGDKSYGAAAIDLTTVRVCREGEDTLAKLIFDMSAISMPRYMTKEDIKKLQKEDPKKCEARVKDYEEFDMSHTEEIFNMCVANRFDEVNQLIFEDNKEFFQSEGKQCEFGVFLGARVSDDHKIYQSYMRPLGNFGMECTFKKAYKAVKSAVMDGFSAYGPTFMPKAMVKKITDANYGYSDIWQDSFVFTPYDVEEFEPAKDEVVAPKVEVDDLPF